MRELWDDVSAPNQQNGYVTWVCRTHDRSADACHVGRIPESEIRAAFLRMYRKLKCNADMILKPAMEQMNALDAILQQNNPKTLTINRAIAEATEESHKISTLLSMACWTPIPARLA